MTSRELVLTVSENIRVSMPVLISRLKDSRDGGTRSSANVPTLSNCTGREGLLLMSWTVLFRAVRKVVLALVASGRILLISFRSGRIRMKFTT